MPWLAKFTAAVSLAVGGFVAGAIVTDDPDRPAPSVEVREVPKFVEKEVIRETRVMPDSCRALVDASEKADVAVDKYEKTVGALPNMLDDAYRGIYNQDLKTLNRLKQQGIDLEAETIQLLLDIRAARERVDELRPKCNQATRN
jgi:hypothetical protein